MSITETAARLACIDIYSPITPNVFEKQFVIDDVVCGVTLIDNIHYIALQGTVDLKGWEADLDASPVRHPILGTLHHGFYTHIPSLVKQLLKYLPKDATIICCGHSKGAANAAILAALLKLQGLNIKQIFLFACPNPGYKKFSDWMKENIIGISYANGVKFVPWLSDPVPKVPLLPFTAIYPHLRLTQWPLGFKKFIPTNWHDAELYYNGVKNTA